MRILRTLVAVGAAAAAAAALSMAAPSAMAEPILHGKTVTPAPYDIVGGGSDTTQYVMDQLTSNYDNALKHHSATNPYIFSWDAVPPAHPLDTKQVIHLKAGCPAELRPNGSSSGISALTSYAHIKYKGKSYPCLDFARSSRPRKSTDPTGRGGVEFAIFASDAVTYGTAATTNVPNNLTQAQLAEIFGCSIPAANGFPAGTWGALLGTKVSAAVGAQSPNPVVPQAGSGTLSFWMTTALGLTSTAEPSCGSAKNDTMVSQQPEENEGTWPGFKIDTVNLLYPFSIGSFVSQAYHSKKCGKGYTKGKNLFGCNQTGIFHLNGISGLAPTVKGKGGVPETNPKWNTTPFHRFLFNVVPYYAASKDHISPKLEKFFGRHGFFCSSKNDTVIEDYGFEPTAACGFTD